MDWLVELLKAQGIDEGVIAAFVEEFKKVSPKYVMPKDKYNDEAEKRKKAEDDVAERDKQLDVIKAKAGNDVNLQAVSSLMTALFYLNYHGYNDSATSLSISLTGKSRSMSRE